MLPLVPVPGPAGLFRGDVVAVAPLDEGMEADEELLLLAAEPAIASPDLPVLEPLLLGLLLLLPVLLLGLLVELLPVLLEPSPVLSFSPSFDWPILSLPSL